MGFTGLTDLTSTNAELRTDDATFSVALQGSTTVLGAPGRRLVTATWGRRHRHPAARLGPHSLRHRRAVDVELAMDIDTGELYAGVRRSHRH